MVYYNDRKAGKQNNNNQVVLVDATLQGAVKRGSGRGTPDTNEIQKQRQRGESPTVERRT
jgi:hypothetical protein